MEPARKSLVNENIFTAVAAIAAELGSVTQVAWEISLAAKNAKVISAQAGDRARGFQPVTDFINDIAQQVIEGVSGIRAQALQLSHIAVQEHRLHDARNRFEQAHEKAREGMFAVSMTGSLNGVVTNLQECRKHFKKTLNYLIGLLENLDECMISAKSIASVSRIVASSAAEHQGGLQVVSDNLDNSAEYIRSKLSDSHHHLNNVSMLTRQLF